MWKYEVILFIWINSQNFDSIKRPILINNDHNKQSHCSRCNWPIITQLQTARFLTHYDVSETQSYSVVSHICCVSHILLCQSHILLSVSSTTSIRKYIWPFTRKITSIILKRPRLEYIYTKHFQPLLNVCKANLWYFYLLKAKIPTVKHELQ